MQKLTKTEYLTKRITILQALLDAAQTMSNLTIRVVSKANELLEANPEVTGYEIKHYKTSDGYVHLNASDKVSFRDVLDFSYRTANGMESFKERLENEIHFSQRELEDIRFQESNVGTLQALEEKARQIVAQTNEAISALKAEHQATFGFDNILIDEEIPALRFVLDYSKGFARMYDRLFKEQFHFVVTYIVNGDKHFLTRTETLLPSEVEAYMQNTRDTAHSLFHSIEVGTLVEVTVKRFTSTGVQMSDFKYEFVFVPGKAKERKDFIETKAEMYFDADRVEIVLPDGVE